MTKNAAMGSLITHATGNLRDPKSRPSEYGQIGTMDPLNRVAGFYITQGLFKLVPILVSTTGSWNSLNADPNGKGKQPARPPIMGEFGEAFNARSHSYLSNNKQINFCVDWIN